MLYDIAFNLSSNQYAGIYNDKKKHQPDIERVLLRAKEKRIIPFFIGSNLSSTKKCIEAAKKYNTFSTAGIHPNDASKHISDLPEIIKIINGDLDVAKHTDVSTNLRFFDKEIKNHIIAVGECGLDYYRMTSTVKDQKYVFKTLLDLNKECYFLHNRESFRDFSEMISDYQINGVVHSFDGSIEEAQHFIRKGLFIGLNGCSLKYAHNIDVIEEIPVEKILIETDAPYCRIAKSYAGYKYLQNTVRTNEKKGYDADMVWKYRNEPITLTEVLEAVSQIKEIDIDILAEHTRHNTRICFGKNLIDLKQYC